MKVGTDSLLLGSWAVERLSRQFGNLQQTVNCLDIGTGSGLLSIMLSQWSEPFMSGCAVEIDTHACRQARLNIAASPWPESVTVFETDIQSFQPEITFDVIISNPPYFPEVNSLTNAYRQQSPERFKARNQENLSLGDLCASVQRLLSNSGAFYAVLPASEHTRFTQVLNDVQLYCQEHCWVSTLADKPASRILYEVVKQPCRARNSELNIYSENRVYTQEYKQLCKDYYLHF